MWVWRESMLACSQSPSLLYRLAPMGARTPMGDDGLA